MCTQFNVSPAINSIHPYSHWITPEIEKYRYDTRFFVATLPSSVHKAAIDATEVTDMSWFAPDEAISAHKNGTINLPPPTWITLELLSRVPQLEDLLATCSTRTFYSPSSSPSPSSPSASSFRPRSSSGRNSSGSIIMALNFSV
jgi:hypothetical protein